MELNRGDGLDRSFLPGAEMLLVGSYQLQLPLLVLAGAHKLLSKHILKENLALLKFRSVYIGYIVCNDTLPERCSLKPAAEVMHGW